MSEYQGSSQGYSPDKSDAQGLPNLDSIASLANEIFQALPNAAPFFAGISGLQAASATSTASPTARPQVGVTSAPPPFTSPALERQVAATPAYYFAENANQYPLASIQVDQLATQASPHDFGLPGEDDLRELLAENRFVTHAPVSKPSAPELPSSPELKVPGVLPHTLESHSRDYHQPQSAGSDRVAAQSSHLPGEKDIQQLLAAEFNFTRFDAPASAATPAPDSRFYFLDSGARYHPPELHESLHLHAALTNTREQYSRDAPVATR